MAIPRASIHPLAWQAIGKSKILNRRFPFITATAWATAFIGSCDCQTSVPAKGITARFLLLPAPRWPFYAATIEPVKAGLRSGLDSSAVPFWRHGSGIMSVGSSPIPAVCIGRAGIGCGGILSPADPTGMVACPARPLFETIRTPRRWRAVKLDTGGMLSGPPLPSRPQMRAVVAGGYSDEKEAKRVSP